MGESLRGVIVGATLPSPEAYFFVETSLGRGEVDVRELLGETRRYRDWLARKEEVWNPRVSAAVGMRWASRQTLANRVTLHVYGRMRERIVLVIPAVPGAFYSTLQMQRFRLTNYLEAHALPLQTAKRQQRLWLLPASRVQEFLEVTARIDNNITTLNRLLEAWRQEAVTELPESMRLFREAIESLKPLHRVYWRVWPVSLQLLEEMPRQAQEQLRQALRNAVVDSLWAIIEPELDQLRRHPDRDPDRRAQRLATRIASVLRELGLEDIASEAAELAATLLRSRAEKEEARRRLEGLSGRLATI